MLLPRTGKHALLAATMVLLLGTLFVGSGSRVGAQQETDEAPAEPSFQNPDEAEFVPGQIIVKWAAGTPESELEELNQRNDASIEEEIEGTRLNVIDLPQNLPVDQAIQRYENSPVVEYAEPNFLVFPTRTPNDPRYPEQWGLNNTGQTGGTRDADIDAPEAWQAATGSPDTIVAVIDSGVDINHEDLAGNVWVNQDEIPNNDTDDDNNGYVDDVNGYDFLHNDSTVFDAADGDEHGTHVAGTIAAEGDNGTGVVGVNWQADIMALKFLNSNGNGTISDAVSAIEYAADNGAKISNNSWGYSGPPSEILRDAVAHANQAGQLFVAAAGNGGKDGVGDDNDVKPRFYPASYSTPNTSNIVSVAATNSRDRLAAFSNYGDSTVDLGAPGVAIRSTLPGNGYGKLSGTSMATPHVAGAAALLKSENPGLSDEQIKKRLLSLVDKKSSLKGKAVTGGRLNVAALLGKGPTKLSLDADPNVTVFPGSIKLSGKLTTRAGYPLSSRRINVLARRAGATSFRKINEITTASDGTFNAGGIRPVKRTYYRVSFGGNNSDGLERSVSPSERVRVRARVRLNMNQKNLKLGGKRGMVGRVLPKHSSYVRIAIKRNGDVIDRQRTNLDRDSRYRFVYRPSRPGNYRFYAIFPSDRDHLYNRSRQMGFRVVR